MQIKNFGYFWLDSWVMANVIQLATQDFCSRYLNQKNDPCGRQYDQMTQAALPVPPTSPKVIRAIPPRGRRR